MRRLVALWVLLGFVAATAAPAIAACRMGAAQKECCCEPAPFNSICAPDCCDSAKPAHRIGDVTTRLRGFAFVAQQTLVLALTFVDRAPIPVPPTAGVLVGLHERAAPRLPLRV